MPKTATPRKPETVSRNLAETRNTSKNRSLSSLLGIGDNEKRLATDIGSGLNDVIGRGTIAGLLGLPGDLGGAAENGLRSLLGLPQVVPYGGSEHIGQKMEQAGLVSDVRRPKTELLASLISPAQAATAGYKAPQMARAGVKALDNLSAPRTMGRQQGAIENLWHGSPHTFDRFDLSKIGTGEGAQAFGHGAYLAESADTARTYSADRAYVGKVMAGLPPDTNFNDPNWLAQKVVDETGDLEKAKAHLRMIQRTAGKYQSDETKAITQASIDLIESGNVAPKGNLYQTRLAWPDAREATDPLSPDHFLHWDKPLSEQSEFVRRALGGLHGEVKPRVFAPTNIGLEPRGAQAHQALQDYFAAGRGNDAFSNNASFGSMEASNELRDLGIPGIRYLDGGSRGAGAGSHNYVVFDDKLIDIVSRNGQPVGNLGKMVAPQDEALRVAQANAAKPVSEGGLGLRPDNTPEERAAAMGFDTPAYHGTGADVREFDPELSNTRRMTGTPKGAVVVSSSPRSASSYANESTGLGHAGHEEYGNGGNVLPLLVSKGNNLAVNAKGDYWIDLMLGRYPDIKTTNEFASYAKKKGRDSATVKNVVDNATFLNEDRIGDTTFIFDPRRIRSRFAAFDPMRRESSDLLAGIAPFGAIPWLQDEQP